MQHLHANCPPAKGPNHSTGRCQLLVSQGSTSDVRKSSSMTDPKCSALRGCCATQKCKRDDGVQHSFSMITVNGELVSRPSPNTIASPASTQPTKPSLCLRPNSHTDMSYSSVVCSAALGYAGKLKAAGKPIFGVIRSDDRVPTLFK